MSYPDSIHAGNREHARKLAAAIVAALRPAIDERGPCPRRVETGDPDWHARYAEWMAPVTDARSIVAGILDSLGLNDGFCPLCGN